MAERTSKSLPKDPETQDKLKIAKEKFKEAQNLLAQTIKLKKDAQL